jgi:hypothetical protein
MTCLALAGLLAMASPGTRAAASIWAEATVSKDAPYAQESVVYTVRVFSPGNLQTVEISPPAPSGAALEELERGVVSTRVVRGRPVVVTEYRYVLTPFASGTLEVPPARLKVQSGAALGQRTWGTEQSTSLSTGPVRVTAQALPAGAPIPLRFLDVKAQWGQAGAERVGDPLTLTVTVKGLGATGGRLPSVAPLLKSDDFRVYPERPQVDWRWGSTGPGTELWGRRVETFTVVPEREGMLRFPPIELAWWDVAAQRGARARVADLSVPVGAEALARQAAGGDGSRFLERLLTRQGLVEFVLPVAGGIAVAFLLGWWLGFVRTGEDARPAGAPAAGGAGPPAPTAPAGSAPRLPSPSVALAAVGSAVSAAGARAVGRVREWPALRRAQAATAAWVQARRSQAGEWLAALMPLRVQAWWCVRCAVRETRPDALCRVVRGFACQRLKMPPSAPLERLTDYLTRGRSEAAAHAGLRDALRELESAAYTGRDIDLRAWKREFRRGFRRALAASGRGPIERPRRGLPELNP